MEQQKMEPAKSGEEKVQEKKSRGSWWSLWKSISTKKEGKGLKKDQLLIGLLLGVLLIVIAWPVEEKDKTSREASEGGTGEEVQGDGFQDENDSFFGAAEAENGDKSLSTDAYTREMEERLAAALSTVEGVGKVQVLITWKSSSEKVVEKDAPGTSQTVEETDSSGGQRITKEASTEETTVYLEAEDGSKTPYVIKEIQPQAEGVLVIAQGGGDPQVAENVLEAVQALFPLSAHKIKIMKMEGSK